MNAQSPTFVEARIESACFVGPGKLAPLQLLYYTVQVEVLHVYNEIPAVIASGWDDLSVTLQMVQRVRYGLRARVVPPLIVGLAYAKPVQLVGIQFDYPL